MQKFKIINSLSGQFGSTYYLANSFSTKVVKNSPSYLHHLGKYPLLYRTVGQQISISAEQYANREAIVSENTRLTFAELKDQVDRIAAGFIGIGLQPGDRIGIWAPNTINWYLNAMAAARAGLISVGINPAYQIPEVEYCLKKVGIKAIVCAENYKSQNYYQMLSHILPEMNKSGNNITSEQYPNISVVIVDSKHKLQGAIKFADLQKIASHSEIAAIESMQDTIHPDTCCNIQFTSGTTGKPKAAQLTHHNFINNGFHNGIRNELDLKPRRICVQVPLFHAYGFVVGIMAGMYHGSTLVLPGPGFNADESIKAIIAEKCDIVFGTPTMYVEMLAALKRTGSLPPIDVFVTGGAPCSPQLFKDIKEKLGAKKIKSVFGMTETTAVIFQTLFNETNKQVLTTVGHIQDGIEAKTIDHLGNTVPFGTAGELCIRGYVNMLGYWDDVEKTNETIGSDRWLKTGDQFILREDGYGQIVGRLKDLIIRGGENLYPKEIEDFLNTHPDILESHCIGVPDERMGEEVCAFVRLQSNTTLDKAGLKEFCRDKIAHFKIPKYLRIVEEFPKTVSGKIQKFKLREAFDETELQDKVKAVKVQ